LLLPNPARASAPAAASRLDRRVLFLCCLHAALTFGWYLVWKHFMAERSGDEAIFENCFWNAWHGNGLRSWLEGGYPHLAVHFSPIILLLLPLYGMFPSMHVVHLVVSLATAAAGYATYAYARRRLDRATSTLLAAAFLLNPTVVLQTFMDFHEQALGLLPLVLVFLAYDRRSLLGTLAWAVLLLSAREDNALLVLGLAAHAAIARRDGRMALGLAMLAVGWMALYRGVAVEWLGGGDLPSVFAGTYGMWGNTPGEMMKTLVTEPARVIRHLFSAAPIRYLAQLLAPFLGVVPFADPIALVMLPQLFLILLSSPEGRMYEIRTHYSLIPIAVLYVAAAGSLARLAQGALGAPRPRLARGIAVAMALVSLATVPVWLTRAVGRLNPHAADVREVMAMVPDTASVTAPLWILTEMARRPRLAFAWERNPVERTTTAYVLLEERNRMFFQGRTEEVFQSAELDSSLARAGYRKLHAKNGFHLWRRE
jgi:uncharacterized membrane protein